MMDKTNNTKLKLPLFLHSSHLCDPEFKGNHTYVIKELSKCGGIIAECTGCGTQWSGNYRKHWMPEAVGLALMTSYPRITLRWSASLGGFVL